MGWVSCWPCHSKYPSLVKNLKTHSSKSLVKHDDQILRSSILLPKSLASESYTQVYGNGILKMPPSCPPAPNPHPNPCPLAIQSNTTLGAAVKWFYRCNYNPKLFGLKVGRLFRWAWSNHIGSWKEEKVREIQRPRKSWLLATGFEDGRGHMKRTVGSLWKLNVAPIWQTMRKRRHQSFNAWDWLLLRAGMNLEVDSSPEFPERNTALCETLSRESSHIVLTYGNVSLYILLL